MLEGLSGETRLFPILGDPIAYVRSPRRLTVGFEAKGENAICVPMLVAEGHLEGVLRGLALIPNIGGLLVTMPHKIAAFGYCATSSERARLLGAVSVMRRNADGSWHGDMLDGLAFVKAQTDQGARLENARVLLIGAGGAGSAIAVALLEAGVGDLIIHDADQSRAAFLIGLLAKRMNGRVAGGPPDPSGCDVVCNATPLGMASGDPLPVPTHLLTPSMFIADVVAGHGVTPLLRAAGDIGCRTADGVQMVEAAQEMMIDFMLNAGAPG